MRKEDPGESTLRASQEESDRSIRVLMNTWREKRPFVVVMGSEYTLAGFQAPHRYCVLGWYIITQTWAEKEFPGVLPQESDAPDYFLRYKFAFQFLPRNTIKPWFMTEGCVRPSIRRTYTCTLCGKDSPKVYTAGICLIPDCDRFWKVQDGEHWSDAREIEIDPEFLCPVQLDSDLETLIPESIIPPLPPLNIERFTPCALWCRRCGRITCREIWDKWICASCGYLKTYPNTPVPCATLSSTSTQWKDHLGCLAATRDSGIKRYVDVIDQGICRGLIRATYVLPTGGRIEHVLADPHHKLKKIGSTIFEQYQTGVVPLRRWRFSAHRVKGFLTQNFSHNAGEAYRHAISMPYSHFASAPEPVRRARSVLQAVSPHTQINELLSIFYMDGQKMSWHDDGEKEVQGPIISWSLGSDSIMRFRRKVKKKKCIFDIGRAKAKKRHSARLHENHLDSKPVQTESMEPIQKKQPEELTANIEDSLHTISGSVSAKIDEGKTHIPRKTVLKLVTRHGDLVIMYGKAVQTHYEHAVEPQGLRLCVTGRTLRTLTPLSDEAYPADPPWSAPPGSVPLDLYLPKEGHPQCIEDNILGAARLMRLADPLWNPCSPLDMEFDPIFAESDCEPEISSIHSGRDDSESDTETSDLERRFTCAGLLMRISRSLTVTNTDN
ncbi:hypothetical protein SpCBS45565_g04182 [Spizellomyces sp. 'palustris']|nr:hypothetical protein SpCBS45565_g04182 [Spizellomyces sp. 'palustris']